MLNCRGPANAGGVGWAVGSATGVGGAFNNIDRFRTNNAVVNGPVGTFDSLRLFRSGSNLEYPFQTRPELGETIAIAPGVYWVRMRLPMQRACWTSGRAMAGPRFHLLRPVLISR